MGGNTNIRENAEGIETRITSLIPFPTEIHQRIKDRACKGNSVGSIYSDAISDMKVDIDSGEKIELLAVPKTGNKAQVWLREDAKDDLAWMAGHFLAANPTIVYNAMLRHFEKERNRPGAFKSDL